MKAWGCGDEKVIAKNFELLFNAARSENQAKDPQLPRRWQSKSNLGSGVGGPPFKKFHPHLPESVPQVGDLHPMTPGSVIVASVGSGAQVPHSDDATHPEVLPPNSRDISGCHLSSFLCLSEDYQVAVQAGTALGHARNRLATKVKTLERDLARLRKGKPPAQAAQAGEGPQGAEAPPGDRAGGGGGSAAGVRYLVAGARAWHAQAKACAGQMSAVSTGLRMAMMASGQQADVDSVAPDAPKVTAALEDVRRQCPPHRLTSAAMHPSFVEAVAEQSSQGYASRSSAPGGGGGCSSPFNLGTTCPF